MFPTVNIHINYLDIGYLPTLSICSFVKDEKDIIRDMLECAKNINPDEIIIIDEHSTDGTREILKEYNVNIIDGKLDDNYSQIRNLAISKATKDWILFIDADEILEESLCESLKTRELLRFCELSKYDVVAFKRKNYIDNIFMERTYPDYQNRLLRNNGNIKYVKRVHEIPIGFKNRFFSDYHILHKKSRERQNISDYKYSKMKSIEHSTEFYAGAFLFTEGFLSMVYSQDKRNISQAGRLARMVIGIWLISKYY